MTTGRSFWSWHRVGLASALAGAPAAGAARAGIPATLSLAGGGTAAVPVDLLGPGDVAGIETAQIRRTEPVDRCPDFEPGQFPYVELRDADLPWRFTPEGPRSATLADPEHGGAPIAQQRLQPWLALVVVAEEEAVLTAPAGSTTARITCDAALLPDPAEAWAWAHVQLTERPGVSAEAGLADSDWSYARILAPVRLAAEQGYVAALVPTYAAGVAAAGLPLPGSDPLGPAWGATGSVTLPAYLTWTFRTAAAGSFETLSRRLRPVSAPDEAAGVPVLIDEPRWGATAPAGRTVFVEGALRPLDGGDSPPADADFAASLAVAVSADVASGATLQLRPPLYGQDHAGGATAVKPVTADPGWFAELNTDARRRSTAGLAGWAVIVDQDRLVDAAWSQLTDARPETADATAPDVAAAVTGSLLQRHQPVVSGAVGPSASLRRLLRTGGPIARTGLARTSLAGPGVGASASRVTRTRRAAPLMPMSAALAAPTTPMAGAGGFRPTYDEPAFGLLRTTSPQWVLPGLGGVPLESVLLMRTNPAFVEAFLVGLDHALGRELQWRRFPLDATGTMFRTFWPVPNIAGTTPAEPAMAEIGSWDPASHLGDHLAEGGQLVLVLRGSLIRRFPATRVYLSQQASGGAEQLVAPEFEASLGADTTVIGFPTTIDDIESAPGGTTWWVVLQEAVPHPRFGLDDAPVDGTTATVKTWQDLDWGHPQVAGHGSVPVAGPLTGVGRPTGATTAFGTPPDAHWGADSASFAAALTRAPVRVRIPVSLWRTPPVH